jgi:hypothetical protein
MDDKTRLSNLPVSGTEHWTGKDGGVKLFLWNKQTADTSNGVLLFVHGSSMA